MEGLSMSIGFVIRKFDTDLSKCKTCGEIIYGNMYRPVLLAPPDEEVFENTAYCEPCKQELDIPDG